MARTKTQTSRKSITVLLVDDDPDCRTILRDAVAHVDPAIDVREVAGGVEALAYLRRQGPFADAPRPCLIYLDLQMPDVSGQDVLKVIKSDPELKDIPVVMVTGLDDDEQIRLATRNGANSYAVKPDDPAAFLHCVQVATTYWLYVHRLPKD